MNLLEICYKSNSNQDILKNGTTSTNIISPEHSVDPRKHLNLEGVKVSIQSRTSAADHVLSAENDESFEDREKKNSILEETDH